MTATLYGIGVLHTDFIRVMPAKHMRVITTKSFGKSRMKELD